MNHRQSATSIHRPRFSRLPVARGAIIATETTIRRVLSKLKGTSIRIVGLSRSKNNESECTPTPHHCGVVGPVGRHVPLTIDALPDDVLLDIFDYDRLLSLTSRTQPCFQRPWNWQRLAHVCRGWRSLVFASPRRLQLRLYFTSRRTPATLDLSCWPPSLPIAIIWHPNVTGSPPLPYYDGGGFFPMFEHRDRICEINLAIMTSLIEKTRDLRHGPFPALERLRLKPPDFTHMTLLLPSKFLGHSAPRLRDIHLIGVAFPTLPHFLLSTRDLASLRLTKIPNIDLFSVEILVDHLPVLNQLKVLEIRFEYWSQSNTIPVPPIVPDHGILQSLTEFRFKGVCRYFEYLVARLEAPFLQEFSIEFLEHPSPSSDIPQLAQFISRTKWLGSPHKTTIEISVREVAIVQKFRESLCRLRIGLEFAWELVRKLDSGSNLCLHLLPFLRNMEQLDIKGFFFSPTKHEQIMLDSTQWLELFRSFPGVKALGVSGSVVQNIASILEQAATGEATKDIFPVLCDLRFNGTRDNMSEILESFVAARQPSDRRPGSAHSIRREDWSGYWSEESET